MPFARMPEFENIRDSRVDVELSTEVARRIRARFRRCWDNAARGLPYLGRDALYVEGWVVVHPDDPLVIEHGWCEVEGRIVDPTYTPLVSRLPPPLRYFGGQVFDAHDVAHAYNRKRLPLSWVRPGEAYDRCFETALLDARKRRTPPVHYRGETRIVHCRESDFDVFIGRPSPWQNPYRPGRDGSRLGVIQRFRDWFIRQPGLLREVEELQGKTLGCWCQPGPCHGEVLASLADLMPLD